MARIKDYAPGWPQDKRPPHAHIEFGSAEHATLLGIGDEASREDMDPKEIARRERQLEHEPVIACPERKRAVNRRNYRLDEPILDGWVTYGRR